MQDVLSRRLKALNLPALLTGCFHRARPSLERPVSRTSSSRACAARPAPGPGPPSGHWWRISKVASTGQPFGSPAGKSRTTVRPMAMQSPGCELSPSTTLIAIERWPSDLVASASCTAPAGRVAGDEHHVLLAERLRVDAFDVRLWALTLVTWTCSPALWPAWPADGRHKRGPAGDRFIGVDRSIGLDAGEVLQHAGDHRHPRRAADQGEPLQVPPFQAGQA